MYDYLIILLVGLIALTGGSWVAIVLGAVGLSLHLLPRVWPTFNQKGIDAFKDAELTKLMSSTVGNALIATGASYLLGVTLRFLI